MTYVLITAALKVLISQLELMMSLIKNELFSGDDDNKPLLCLNDSIVKACALIKKADFDYQIRERN